jgi:CheY-like chemotaxis protein
LEQSGEKPKKSAKPRSAPSGAVQHERAAVRHVDHARQFRGRTISWLEKARDEISRAEEEFLLAAEAEAGHPEIWTARLEGLRAARKRLDDALAILKKSRDAGDPSFTAAAHRPEPAAAPAAPRTILIIEDDRTTEHILRHFLEKEGYVVLSAEEAKEGLRLAEEKRPSLVLLDIMLPGMDGYHALSWMKRSPALAAIPVIILSSLTQEDNIMKGLTEGASDYLTKPFSPVIVVAKVNRILSGGA